MKEHNMNQIKYICFSCIKVFCFFFVLLLVNCQLNNKSNYNNNNNNNNSLSSKSEYISIHGKVTCLNGNFNFLNINLFSNDSLIYSTTNDFEGKFIFPFLKFNDLDINNLFMTLSNSSEKIKRHKKIELEKDTFYIFHEIYRVNIFKVSYFTEMEKTKLIDSIPRLFR